MECEDITMDSTKPATSAPEPEAEPESSGKSEESAAGPSTAEDSPEFPEIEFEDLQKEDNAASLEALNKALEMLRQANEKNIECVRANAFYRKEKKLKSKQNEKRLMDGKYVNAIYSGFFTMREEISRGMRRLEMGIKQMINCLHICNWKSHIVKSKVNRMMFEGRKEADPAIEHRALVLYAQLLINNQITYQHHLQHLMAACTKHSKLRSKHEAQTDDFITHFRQTSKRYDACIDEGVDMSTKPEDAQK